MTKEIKETLINNELIDDEIYLDYIGERLEEEKLTDYVNGVMLTNDDSSGYIQTSRVLLFNPDEIIMKNEDESIPTLNMLVNDRERMKNCIKCANCANIYNLFSINHEINHIIQDLKMQSQEQSILRNLIIRDSISLILDEKKFKSFYYKKYHDRFYNEYNANINCYIDILRELDNIKELNDLVVKSNMIIGKHLIYLYSDIDNRKRYSTPVRNMYRLYNHIIEICNKHDYNVDIDIELKKYSINDKPKTEFDKLRYGLSINPETYNYIKSVAKGKTKTLNLFEQIKN